MGTITTVNGTINRHKYIEILEDNLWPVIARHFPEQDFISGRQRSRAIHRANDVKNYKEENHINCLEWPAQSPDLNVIENVWLKLKIRLQQRVEVLNTADELSAAIKDIWENLSVDYIQGLYHSIPKRLRKVLKVKGEMTQYWVKVSINLLVAKLDAWMPPSWILPVNYGTALYMFSMLLGCMFSK